MAQHCASRNVGVTPPPGPRQKIAQPQQSRRIEPSTHPNTAQNRERQRAPVHERAAPLVREDGEEGPGDGKRGREVTLGGGEGVGSSSTLEEEETEEDEDLGPDTGGMGVGVDTKGLKRGEDDEDGGPSVPEREGKMDKELVSGSTWLMILLDNVIDCKLLLASKLGYSFFLAVDSLWVTVLETKRAKMKAGM